MPEILMKKNQDSQNPLITRKLSSHQRMKLLCSKIKIGNLKGLSGMMITKGDEI